MNLDRYKFNVESSLMVHDFISEGPKGSIPKMVQYEKTNINGVYNLAFGDKDLHTNTINDTIISDNGDSQKVLATVAFTLYTFTKDHPGAWIHITGSTNSRTRLYRMGIIKYLIEIQKDFEVYGELENDWEEFETGKQYTAFLVKRKNSKFVNHE